MAVTTSDSFPIDRALVPLCLRSSLIAHNHISIPFNCTQSHFPFNIHNHISAHTADDDDNAN